MIYDVSKLTADKNEVLIYAATGQLVFQSTLHNNTGFYNKNLDLSSLASGMYLLKFISGEHSISKKIILR